MNPLVLDFPVWHQNGLICVCIYVHMYIFVYMYLSIYKYIDIKIAMTQHAFVYFLALSTEWN
jgi:hypothetical protein